jgi:choline dehydrogenase-like flavoprotein
MPFHGRRSIQQATRSAKRGQVMICSGAVQNERQVIVVGSGPAASSAATFLCRAGVEVLVLEAGLPRSAPGVTARVGGLTVAKYKKELGRRPGVTMTGDPATELFEELAPGGLSNHWSCAVPRFSPDDFADAQRAGTAHAWPIGYEDLAPWYDRVEPLLQIAGTRESPTELPAPQVTHARELGTDWSRVIEAARGQGRAVVAMPYAYGGSTTLTFTGTPFNAFTRLVKPLLRARRLRVRYGARALRLEWSPSARRVDGVVFRDLATGREDRARCSAVVLGAGAVNTAQILLESTSLDFPDGLGNTDGVLGRYFHDHPVGKLVIDVPRPMPVQPAAYVTRPRLDHSRPLYAAAGMQWSGASALVRSLLKGHPGRSSSIGFSVFGTMATSADDRVTLDPTRPRVDGSSALALSVRHPPESKEVLDETRDAILDLLDQAGWQPKVRVWKIEAVGNSVHYGGTCRMHESPRFGMTDRFGRLHAVSNVVVADSSAFTTTPEKNPVLTAMALAARASSHLAGALKSSS